MWQLEQVPIIIFKQYEYIFRINAEALKQLLPKFIFLIFADSVEGFLVAVSSY